MFLVLPENQYLPDDQCALPSTRTKGFMLSDALLQTHASQNQPKALQCGRLNFV